MQWSFALLGVRTGPGGALRPDDVPAVESALARYAAARDRLEADATRGIDALRAWVAARRERGQDR